VTGPRSPRPTENLRKIAAKKTRRQAVNGSFDRDSIARRLRKYRSKQNDSPFFG
jgi:hypothetical protein